MIVIFKPTYSCNLACKYCYLSNDTKTNHCAESSLILKALLQVKDVLKPGDRRVTTLLWHGGEPLVWGYNNFKNIFEFVEKNFEGYNFQHSVQTNLSLIDDKFIELFKQYKVNVSFSLDGTREIHDSQRVDKAGKPTFDKIISKYLLCKANGIDPRCIVVATKKHIGKIAELYDFMANNGISFKLNPIFCAGEAENNNDEYGLSPVEYAKMSIELFDLWYNDSSRRINNQKFVDIASALVTGQTSLCVFSNNCQDNVFAISPVGEVFPCGRFCDESLKQYSYGNINTTTLSDILRNRKSSEIYEREHYINNSDCKDCRYFSICHGGCLHDGFLVNKDFKTKTILCEAYKMIFHHIENVIRKDESIFDVNIKQVSINKH